MFRNCKTKDTDDILWFQAKYPILHLSTGDTFYLRQLLWFIFGIYSAKSVEYKMYTWPERLNMMLMKY